MPVIKPRQKPFSQLVDESQEDLGVKVFPHRVDLSTSNARVTQVTWHQFPSESQQLDRMEAGQDEDLATTLSACREVQFGQNEWPRRLKRGSHALLCDRCFALGDLTEEEFQVQADSVVREAHARRDQKSTSR